MVRFGFLAVFMMMLASATAVGETVDVLTETPVTEFTLPDGSVLTNAFVWRRSSEGLMIVHDDGQHFLNFKLLPDAWKAAYLGATEAEGSAELERPPVVLVDKYNVASLLDAIPGFSDAGIEWLLREEAGDEAEQTVLTLALFHSLLSNNRDKAKRYFLFIEEKGFRIDSVKLEKIFNKCPACSGKGAHEQDCPACKGAGECAECEGTGLQKLGLGKSKIDCKVCEGSGECAECEGEKRVVLFCGSCRGRGQTLDRPYCEVNRDHLVRLVNATVGDDTDFVLLRDPSSGIGEVLSALPGLKPEAEAFYVSELYEGAMDSNILVACVMHSLLKGKMKAAGRFNLMVEVQFSKNKLLNIDDYLTVCKTCKAVGFVEQVCPSCKKQKKKGQCSECEGTGVMRTKLRAEFECVACKGSGECATCEGDGVAHIRCASCEGRGRIFQSMRAEIKLKILVDDLNKYYNAQMKAEKEEKETVQSVSLENALLERH